MRVPGRRAASGSVGALDGPLQLLIESDRFVLEGNLKFEVSFVINPNDFNSLSDEVPTVRNSSCVDPVGKNESRLDGHVVEVLLKSMTS